MGYAAFEEETINSVECWNGKAMKMYHLKITACIFLAVFFAGEKNLYAKFFWQSSSRLIVPSKKFKTIQSAVDV